MSKLLQYRFRILALVIMMLILATASYGFAAANTIADAGLAGEGSNTVSGYNVTLVNYVLDAGDPTQLDSVLFTLDSSAASVYAGIDTNPASGIEWSASCTDLGGNRFDCDLSAITHTVEDAAVLHVAAGQ
jgi:hypothetical protein